MSNETTTPAAPLPDYITSATPNPAENRAPWYTNTAPTYAGIFLWFVFWQDAIVTPNLGGALAGGVVWALVSLVLAAVICHFFLLRGSTTQTSGSRLSLPNTAVAQTYIPS